MHRHIKTVHADFNYDEMMDEIESPENIEEDKDSNNGDGNDSSSQYNTEDGDDDKGEVEELVDEAQEVEEDGADEDSYDPWHVLIQEAFERCQSEFDERVVKHIMDK